MVLAPIGVALVGVALEQLFLRRLYRADPMLGLLFTFGLAMTAEQTLRMIWGASGLPFPIPPGLRGQLLIGDFIYSYYRLTVLAVSIATIAACWLLLTRTAFGMVVRAGTRDPEMVRAMGVSLRPAQAAVFALGVGLAGLAGVMSAPLAGVQPAMATEIALFAMVGLGFNLLLGYTGLLSFGHGLFFGVAAYAAALAQIHWFEQSIVLPLLFAIAVTTLLGAVVGFLVLRRRGVYFSLLTLAFTALGFTIAFRWTDVTGGESGLRGVRRVAVLGLDLDNQLAYYYFCAGVALLVAWLTWRIVRSPFRSVLMAVPEDA